MNDHTCCAWCTPPIHVYCAFVDEDIENFQQFKETYTINGIVPGQDMEILDIQPAREADKDHLLKERQKYGNQIIVSEHGEVFETRPHSFGNIWQITYRDLKK